MATVKVRIAALSLFVLAAFCGATSTAGAVSLSDTYWGGINTYSGGPGTANPGLSGDVIGDPSSFDVLSATVTRTGQNNNTLQVVINTNYAGKAGLDSTGYGALFFSTNIFTPSGTGPQYATDVYAAGRYNYAFVMPENPGSGSKSGSYSAGSTVGGLFQISNSNVVMSNVNGNTTTYPNDPNSNFYFRQGQAVQYDPNGTSAIRSGSWTVHSSLHTISFSILDNGLLGDDFILAWTMTCANDVILGEVQLPTGGGGQFETPLPGAFPLFVGGLGLFGFLTRGRKKKHSITPV